MTGASDEIVTAAARAAIGRTQLRRDDACATRCAALTALLGGSTERPAAGTAAPLLSHLTFFPEIAGGPAAGGDGFQEREEFLPAIGLPQRMWASSTIAFHTPLRVGAAIERVAEVTSITQKNGRTGPLAFVQVKHDIRHAGDSSPAITELREIVYRGAAAPSTAAPDVQPERCALPPAAWSRTVTPDPVLLFRYSALTFNPHRIHYDVPYVREVAGYPAPVVHGPLVATFLINLLRHNMPAAVVESFEFKALSPIFSAGDFSVHGQPDDDGRTVRLWAVNSRGALAMSAVAHVSQGTPEGQPL